MTPVPDRPGTFFLTNGGVDPLLSLDGNKVVFIAVTGSAPSIWSVNADGSGGFQRLVDTDTDVPGGGGEKFGYMRSALLRNRNGNVVFLGFGADGLHDGIYTVPVTGGTVKKVVASASVRPENTATTFGYQDFIQNFSYGYLGDGEMSFVAQGGLYAYPAAGDGRGRVVVYPGSNIPTAGNVGTVFSTAPAISGNRVVWEATGGGDALLESYLDERRFAVIVDVATESPSTPGGNFVFSNQFSFANAQVEGATVVFRAFSGTGATIRGIYSVTGPVTGSETGRHQYQRSGRQWKVHRIHLGGQPGYVWSQRWRGGFPRAGRR